jgi:hypothetical protein
VGPGAGLDAMEQRKIYFPFWEFISMHVAIPTELSRFLNHFQSVLTFSLRVSNVKLWLSGIYLRRASRLYHHSVCVSFSKWRQ